MRSSPLHRFDSTSADDLFGDDPDTPSHRGKIERIYRLTQNARAEDGKSGPDGTEAIRQLVAIHHFVADVASNPAMERNLVYNQISRLIFNDVIYPTSWPQVGVTIFMMGAYLSHHHYSKFPNENDSNTIAAWYFVDFCNKNNNDRFLTNDQLALLCGPSEYDDVSLILRLLWLIPRNFTRKYDLTIQSDRADAREEFLSSGYYPISAFFIRHVLEHPPASASPDRSAVPDTALARKLELDQIVDFTHGGNAGRYLVRDTWYLPEQTLTWAKDHVGLFSFSLSDVTIARYILDLDIYVTEFHVNAQRRLKISFNGKTIYEADLVRADTNRIVVPFEAAANKRTALNTIAFHCDPIVPSDFFGDDNRKIGVAIRRLWLRKDPSRYRSARDRAVDAEGLAEPG
ncbi:hypothetical protein [Methylobacterium trifolii]|uniref:Uncharacterized protein n=1 Tax=Methylobacterium trifolii TaxID=1003092 RepID=A0ABQ4TUF6_9HYPH|nr:hypothetical protein [Methylobacterium trifolii]GJE58412.1 hypothetical protein MPOCJGCO_0493 [Methylobacterium trifolii]